MQKLHDVMQDFDYGYISRKPPFERIDHNVRNPLVMYKKWALSSPAEIEKNKIGICFDQCELERDFCNKHDIPCKTFFVQLKYIPNVHTVLMFETNPDEWYVFENAFERFSGIYGPYDDYLSGGISLLNQWVKDMGVSWSGYNVYEYEKPEYGISFIDFFRHCMRNKVYSK